MTPTTTNAATSTTTIKVPCLTNRSSPSFHMTMRSNTSKTTMLSETDTNTETTTIDLYLSSEERYEIWTIKAAERPELLEHYNIADNNNNNNMYYDFLDISFTNDSYNDNNDCNTATNCSLDSQNKIQQQQQQQQQDEEQDINSYEEKKSCDTTIVINDDNTIDGTIDQLPISDGCDIPGWRHYNLTHTSTCSIDDDKFIVQQRNVIHSIGQGCTLLRKESQLPGMELLYQQNESKHSKWLQLKERLLSSSSFSSPIQRISYSVNNENDNSTRDSHSTTTTTNNSRTTLPLHSWFERDNVPVLIEGCCTKDNGWDMNELYFNNLVQKYGSYQWRFSDTHSETTSLYTYNKYIHSLDGALFDDSPLAIYDSQFGNNNSDDTSDNTNDTRCELLQSYTIPTCFDTDLYRYIDNDENDDDDNNNDNNTNNRPPYRWILIGPERSGTGLHIDPVGTHAWVTLIEGCKKWILFPPNTSTCIEDIGMIQNQPQIPSSIWFTLYYDKILQKIKSNSSSSSSSSTGIIECIQYPGETIYVPAGWPHIVLNVELSVAVTENYATEYPSIEHLFSSLIPLDVHQQQQQRNENTEIINDNVVQSDDDKDNNSNEVLLARRLRTALQKHRPDLILPSYFLIEKI